eukprot:1111875-Amphidinium_carterae.1
MSNYELSYSHASKKHNSDKEEPYMHLVSQNQILNFYDNPLTESSTSGCFYDLQRVILTSPHLANPPDANAQGCVIGSQHVNTRTSRSKGTLVACRSMLTVRFRAEQHSV